MGRLDSFQRELANWGNTVIFQESENISECRWLIISFILVLYVHVYFKIFLQSNFKENFFPKISFLASEKWNLTSEVKSFFSTQERSLQKAYFFVFARSK